MCNKVCRFFKTMIWFFLTIDAVEKSQTKIYCVLDWFKHFYINFVKKKVHAFILHDKTKLAKKRDIKLGLILFLLYITINFNWLLFTVVLKLYLMKVIN